MNEIKTVFDIGNDSIKAVVFAKDNGKDIILAKQMEPALGLKKGKILDIEAFTTTLDKMVENFSKKLGGDFFENIVVGISHPEMQINTIIEGKRIMQEEVSFEDTEHLKRIVKDIADKNNYETIKINPVCRILDEDKDKKEQDPIGLKCKKLELMANVFLVPKNFYLGILDAFEKIGLPNPEIIPNILGASDICIDYDHKYHGTVLIDIGKNQTSYVIYDDGFPLGYGTIPLGGEDVTKDISIGMQIDIKEAENLKKTLGDTLIPDSKWDSPIDQYFLTEIITARYEEIFLKINQKLENFGKDGRMPGGFLLIGGGSKMQNLDFLAKQTLKGASFYGKDIAVHIWDLSTNIQFLNLLGAYHRSNKYMEDNYRGMGFNAEKVFGKIGDFFKNLI